MKKRMTRKRYSSHEQIGPDITGLIYKMQEQMVNLERKIDTLIGRSSQNPAEVKSFAKPFQQPGRTRGHGEGSPEGRPAASYRGGGRQDNNYRERILHKAICADCNKECEVPFKPSGGRPVYCKECFAKRKEKFDNRPREANSPQANHFDRPQGAEKKKYAEKRRPAVKRQKSRA